MKSLGKDVVIRLFLIASSNLSTFLEFYGPDKITTVRYKKINYEVKKAHQTKQLDCKRLLTPMLSLHTYPKSWNDSTSVESLT
ncbi:hypothetical protein CEXT_438161 [Caerostris extrusa]|uniref:Uncharacterized protein n=1 Tax=Caerostris extrusa TaxID=172846 RepID=A0AAV4MBD9_CAEEX|nr:hypothetical protein CEXT_438161 [Caerostris extrusa]